MALHAFWSSGHVVVVAAEMRWEVVVEEGREKKRRRERRVREIRAMALWLKYEVGFVSLL